MITPLNPSDRKSADLAPISISKSVPNTAQSKESDGAAKVDTVDTNPNLVSFHVPSISPQPADNSIENAAVAEKETLEASKMFLRLPLLALGAHSNGNLSSALSLLQ